MLNAQYHKNQKYADIKSHHYIISFDPQDSADGQLTAEHAGGSVPSIKTLKVEKENLRQSIEEQKSRLSSLRAEQKDLQIVLSNIDSILANPLAPKKEKRRGDPEL